MIYFKTLECYFQKTVVVNVKIVVFVYLHRNKFHFYKLLCIIRNTIIQYYY